MMVWVRITSTDVQTKEIQKQIKHDILITKVKSIIQGK